MKITFLILIITTLTAYCNFGTKSPQAQETNQSTDTEQTGQAHPIIENIFYNLPLDKSRLDLREIIVNDKRFISTDTTFNNYKPLSFFKGITSDKGLIKSNPDSIQVMLIYGNASLTTEKGGQEDSTKHPMILECQYFFSNKESAEMEYARLLNMVHPIFTDTSSIMDDKWETEYSKNKKEHKSASEKFSISFDPYYRVAISYYIFYTCRWL
jgi:hypothetical protein